VNKDDKNRALFEYFTTLMLINTPGLIKLPLLANGKRRISATSGKGKKA